MSGAAREVGGFLGLEPFRGEPLHAGDVALNSARSCLRYLCRLRGVRSALVPDYMCAAVGEALVAEGVAWRSYPVGEGLLPAGGLEVGEGEWLYLADYFGQLRAGDVERFRALSGGRLVVDEVQGFFRPPWEGADTVYTCRKFVGVADGAWLHTRDGARLGEELPRSESAAWSAHLLGRPEAGARANYAGSLANEARLAAEPPMLMSETTANLLRAVDYGDAKARREANWDALDALLGGRNLLAPSRTEGPFAYPLLVGGAGDARARLAGAGVFVPTLWPNVLEGCPEGSAAFRYARDILPLPVDQRYGAEDMEYVAEEVMRCLAG